MTYQHGALPGVFVDLCADCIDGDHGLGVIGPVSHGAHAGECEGAGCQEQEAMTREQYTARFAHLPDSVALAADFEIECLAGADLPPCAFIARDRHIESPEYWAWLIERVDAVEREVADFVAAVERDWAAA